MIPLHRKDKHFVHVIQCSGGIGSWAIDLDHQDA
jgi:hypothetical protein